MYRCAHDKLYERQIQMKPNFLTATAVALALSACSAQGSAQGADTQMAADPTLSSTDIVNVSAADADEVIAGDASLVVLDVRTPAEFAQGHIKGAINVDFRSDDFANNLAKLDKSRRYLLHCRSGARSSGALEIMQAQGFANVVHMNDGFEAWKAAGNLVAQ